MFEGSASVILSDYVTVCRDFHIQATGGKLMTDLSGLCRGVCTVGLKKLSTIYIYKYCTTITIVYYSIL